MRAAKLILTTLLLMLAGAARAESQSAQIDSIAESQIRGNVPAEKDFNRFMKRDLAAWFKVGNKPVRVEYELLRHKPTQVAVGSPKFYLWVRVYENGAFLEEDAVRVGAVERKFFVVINYFSRTEIERNPARLHKIMPQIVVEKINEKLGR